MQIRMMKLSAMILAAGLTAAALLYFHGRGFWYPYYLELTGRQTVEDVIGRLGRDARSRLRPFFERAGVAYPPDRITLLAVKSEQELELWADAGDKAVYVRSFRVRAQSGVSGPKLREGDRQVPEGVYRIEGLNPNSSYHLSMKLDFPNEFDRRQAHKEGRQNPGSNIFIHGKAVSIGCLAMGDEAIEELFVLVHDVGKSRVKVVIAPTDPRLAALDAGSHPAWVSELYDRIEREFADYPI